MDKERIKEIIEIAKESVDGLEEPLKTNAFNKIIDNLMSERLTSIKKKTKKRAKKKKQINKTKDEEFKKFCTQINRTKYPEIYKFNGSLNKSLFILKIVRDNFKRDGLTPSQIVYILTNIFKIKASKPAVSMALMGARLEVNRSEQSLPGGGKTFCYQLMKQGEDKLQNLIKNKPENEKS